MELISDGTLKDLISLKEKTNSEIADIEASTIMKHIFEAVLYIHKANIVHRDLKPGTEIISNLI